MARKVLVAGAQRVLGTFMARAFRKDIIGDIPVKTFGVRIALAVYGKKEADPVLRPAALRATGSSFCESSGATTAFA